MRIDYFLKKTLIIKQRSTAKNLCRQGRVRINDCLVKSSKTVHAGDVIEIELGASCRRRIRVLKMPLAPVRRGQVNECYEVVSQ